MFHETGLRGSLVLLTLLKPSRLVGLGRVAFSEFETSDCGWLSCAGKSEIIN